jgi:hypothetical protein
VIGLFAPVMFEEETAAVVNKIKISRVASFISYKNSSKSSKLPEWTAEASNTSSPS